jgi:hypothetical protein
MMRIAAGMGKPTCNELLAKYHLCVAAVWIDSEVTSIRRQNL